jgi:prepilin-type N-terminal cleavage/methylation domain-containing protein
LNKRGFTLVEVLLAMLLVLSATTIFNFAAAAGKNRISVAEANYRQVLFAGSSLEVIFSSGAPLPLSVSRTPLSGRLDLVAWPVGGREEPLWTWRRRE